MKIQYKSAEFKNTLKDSLEELIFSKPELIAPILMDVVEDICMLNAIKESKKSGMADRKAVEAFLDENRL